MENKLKEGEILFADGKIDEAEEFFLSAIEQDANNKEAYNNLGVVAIQKEDAKSAVDYFTRSLEIDPFYKAAIINYTDLLSTLNQLHIAIPLLEKLVEKDPNDEEIANLLENIRPSNHVRPKIAVICAAGIEKFLKDIVDFLKDRYEVRVYYTTNVQEIDSAIMWSNVVWLEWANELTIALTNHKKGILKDKHVICRLHSYEAFEDFADKISWKSINDLVFVAEHIKDIVLQQVPGLPQMVDNIYIIPNGIKMDKFSFKDITIGKNLAFIGELNFKKGPMLLLHAFGGLVQRDSEYHLYIAGEFENARYQLYFSQMIQEMGLEKNIHLDGWINDVNSWLEDKQYIVCTSILEGHPVGIMEAMARGLKPLIHNFVGARGIYPDKYLWNTIPDFVTMATEGNYNSGEYRKFIETNYSLEIQLQRISKIIPGAYKENTTTPQSPDIKSAELSACS